MGKANLKRPRIGIIPELPSLLSLDHSSCTFDVIGSISQILPNLVNSSWL